MSKTGRNDPCPCGSGKKYKKCCLPTDEKRHLELTRPDNLDALFEDEVVDPDADFSEADDRFDDLDARPDIALEPYVSKEIDRALPELDERRQALVDAWWSAYMDMKDPDRILGHLRAFFQAHPDLVAHLALHEEALFKLGALLVKGGRAGEYIALLKQMRETFPSVYLQGFGYHDRDLIAHALVEQGRNADIAPYLDWFKEYPDADPDNLFAVIDLLMVGECDRLLMELLEATHEPLMRSNRVDDGEDALNILIHGYCAECLDEGGTDASLERLLARLRAMRIPLAARWHDREHVAAILDRIAGELDARFLDDFRATPNLAGYYDAVTLNFMGWLHRERGFTWMKALFYRKQVLRYLLGCIPHGQRPRQPFVFTSQLLDRTLARNARMLLGIDVVKVLGATHALRWFADYLVQRGFISDEQGGNLRRWCREIWESVIDAMRRNRIAASLFKEFPG